MFKYTTIFATCTCFGCAAVAHAQPAAIQLPTFNYTTVNTTVSVPDGGTTYLGGVNSASSGRSSRGVPGLGKIPGLGRGFRNTGIGSSRTAGGMSVTARIIIPEEEEAKLGLLGSSSRDAGMALSATDRRAAFLSRNVSRSHERLSPTAAPAAPQSAPPTAEEIRRRNALASQERDTKAQLFFEKGNQAAAAGKANVAKIYYNMAAKRATGAFKSAILARLDAVSTPAQVAGN